MKNVDWDVLIPELKRWNNGGGIDPETWAGCTGTFQLAVAYTTIFWPDFTEMDGMVFRGKMTRAMLDSWIKNCSGDRKNIEATANHLHILDLHYLGSPDASEERIVFLGNVLREIYRAKLRLEFPDRNFTVDFYEPPNKELQEYQLTFYQS